MSAVWPGSEWVTPAARVSIGEWDVRRFERVRVESSAGDVTDRCLVVVDNTQGGAEAFEVGDQLTVEAGYRDTGFRQTFAGVVTNVERKRRCVVRAADAGLLLERHRIRRTFVNMTPDEIVRACLEDAGVEEYSVAAVGNRRHHFVSPSKTVAQVLRAINRTWGLQHVTYAEPDGTVYWGPWEASPRAELQETQYVFERGANIIALRPVQAGAGELETLWVPGLRHSQVLRLVDPEFLRGTIDARVERVVHDLDANQARTHVRWRAA